jgi:hypothetical protein
MPRMEHVRWIGRSRDAAAVGVPSVGSCLVMIAVVKAHLSATGLGPTLRWIRRHESSTPRTALAPGAFLAACEYAVSMAAALYPGRAMCLERSLTLFFYARRAGISVTYHHGVQPLPFSAHAWIEYGGHVINDAAENVLRFQPLPQVCP